MVVLYDHISIIKPEGEENQQLFRQFVFLENTQKHSVNINAGTIFFKILYYCMIVCLRYSYNRVSLSIAVFMFFPSSLDLALFTFKKFLKSTKNKQKKFSPHHLILILSCTPSFQHLAPSLRRQNH